MSDTTPSPTPEQGPQGPTPPQPSPGGPTPPAAPRRLTRSRDDRWIAGVCGGVGRYAGLDPNLVRLLTVVGAVFSAGTIVIAYIIAWVLMPEE